jgi:hypothetical protein
MIIPDNTSPVYVFFFCLSQCSFIIILSIIAVFDSLASPKMAAKIHTHLTGWLHCKAENPNTASVHIHTISAKVVHMVSTISLCSLSLFI